MFFPDIPLNSGFYRAITVDLGPVGSVVNAPWPIAVTGFCSGPYEKIMNAVFELWSEVMPERAMACCFNLEYLLVGGRDGRFAEPAVLHVVRLDGRRLGRPQRQGRRELHVAASSASALAVQPFEGQERLAPVLTTEHTISPTPAVPGSSAAAAASRRAACSRRPKRRSCPTAATARAPSRGASRAGCRRSRTACG